MYRHLSAALLAGVALGLAAPAHAAPSLAAKSYRDEGVRLLKSKRYPEAIKALRRAVTFSTDYSEAWVDLGNAQLATRDFTGAAKSFQSALLASPGLSVAQYNLAYSLRKGGDLPNAVVAYRNYLQSNPRDADAYYGLAETLRAASKPLEAADAYDQYATLEQRPQRIQWVTKARQQAALLRQSAAKPAPTAVAVAAPAPKPAPAAKPAPKPAPVAKAAPPPPPAAKPPPPPKPAAPPPKKAVPGTVGGSTPPVPVIVTPPVPDPIPEAVPEPEPEPKVAVATPPPKAKPAPAPKAAPAPAAAPTPAVVPDATATPATVTEPANAPAGQRAEGDALAAEFKTRPPAFDLGLAALRNGDFAGALPHLEAAVRAASEDAIVLAALGSARLGMGNAVEATEAYRLALATAPAAALPGVQLGLAEALRLRGDRAEATRLYNAVVQSDASNDALKKVATASLTLISEDS